jgi:hypothetical protein
LGAALVASGYLAWRWMREGRLASYRAAHKGDAMDIDVLAIAGIALLLIFRLDRLGKQIEVIRHELMPDERRRDDLGRHRGPHWTLGAMCALLVAWLYLHSQAEQAELEPVATPLRHVQPMPPEAEANSSRLVRIWRRMRKTG